MTAIAKSSKRHPAAAKIKLWLGRTCHIYIDVGMKTTTYFSRHLFAGPAEITRQYLSDPNYSRGLVLVLSVSQD